MHLCASWHLPPSRELLNCMHVSLFTDYLVLPVCFMHFPATHSTAARSLGGCAWYLICVGGWFLFSSCHVRSLYMVHSSRQHVRNNQECSNLHSSATTKMYVGVRGAPHDSHRVAPT